MTPRYSHACSLVDGCSTHVRVCPTNMRGGGMPPGEEAAMTDQTPAQSEDTLTYRGCTWRVESEPEVIEERDGATLVEVWVRRGEDIE